MWHPRWSQEEEQILRENLPKLSLNGKTGPMTKETLLKLLPKKTWDSIRWKTRMLGLRRDFKTVYAPLQLAPEIRGYIAGLVDGEGCISFIKHTRKSGLMRYNPYVSIANTDLEVLKWVETTTGLGLVRRLSTPPAKLREKYSQKPWMWSFAYTWQVGNMAGIYRFLTDIKDLLRIKKEQAELMLEFFEIEAVKPLAQSIRNEKTGYFERRVAIPTTERQHEIYVRMRYLNRRGKNMEESVGNGNA